MALTVSAANLTEIDDADDATNWTTTNLAAGHGIDTDQQIEGSGCYAGTLKTAGTRAYILYDWGTNTDLSNTYVRIWCKFKELSKFWSTTLGGIRVRLEDGSGNYGEWFVGGQETSEGWQYFVIDTSTDPDVALPTSPTLTQIHLVGISIFMTTAPAKSDNFFVDLMQYGTGLIITGTNTVAGNGWEEIFEADDTNKYGILQRIPAGYALTGELIFGDASGTGSVDFTDNKNSKIFVKNASAGSYFGLPSIEIVGNGTGTTEFQLGEVVGTGDDRQGVLGGSIVCDQDVLTFDSETDTSDIDACNLYGVTFEHCGIIKMSGSTTQEAIGCKFINCDEIQPNSAEFLNNAIIAPVPDLGLEILSTHNAKQLTFIPGADTDDPIERCYIILAGSDPSDETDDINDSTANDVTLFSNTDNSACCFGSFSKYEELKINVGTARSGGTVTWEYWDGTSWSTLSVTDGTSGFSTTGTNSVTFEAPTDWAARTIKDWYGGAPAEPPLYYIRARVTNTPMSTVPLATQGWIVDKLEHHVHLPTSSNVTLNAFKFFGFSPDGDPKWHGLNDSNSSVTVTQTGGGTMDEDEVEDLGTSSTTINTNVTVTLTGLIGSPATEVRVYDTGTTTELDGQENVTTGSFAFTLDATEFVDIRIHNVEYVYIAVINCDMPATNTSIPIQQQFDRNYSNP